MHICKCVYKKGFLTMHRSMNTILFIPVVTSLKVLDLCLCKQVPILFKPLHLSGMLHACFGFKGIKDFSQQYQKTERVRKMLLK